MKKFPKYSAITALIGAFALAPAGQALAQEAPVELGTTEDFAILAGTTDYECAHFGDYWRRWLGPRHGRGH